MFQILPGPKQTVKQQGAINNVITRYSNKHVLTYHLHGLRISDKVVLGIESSKTGTSSCSLV